MKKILCASISVFMTFSSFFAYASPSVDDIFKAFDQKNETFYDLEGYDWARKSIEELAACKIISGDGNGYFSPGRTVSRIEFIKMITTACSLIDDTAVSDYEDVDKTHWGYIYASSAKKSGMLNIYDGTLGASEPITREDMAYIAYCALTASGSTFLNSEADNFSDDEEISDYAKNAVYALKSEGIINGMGNGLYMPKATATRAEAAKIIYCALNKFNEDYIRKE